MEIICLDTNILVDYWRAKKKDKGKTLVVALSNEYRLAVSVIAVYELLRGDDSEEDKFWKQFFSKVIILDFDIECAKISGDIYRFLKQKGTMIGTEDILIASVSMKHKCKLATNNIKDFGRIKGLNIV